MQKLQLSIPEPCHENWQQMTPTDQGRFCNACAKEVIDFSTMTDIQVLNYFTSLTHDKVCGRALPEQLNRTISRQPDPKKRLFWYWNYIVMFFMFFGKGNAAKAQGGIKPVTEFSSVKANDIRGKLLTTGGVKSEASRVVTGKVTDIDGNPVSFASIKIKGAATGVSADANGAYSMRAKDNAVLIISGASFKPAVVTVGSQNVINSVLDKGGLDVEKLIVVTVGGMVGRNLDRDYSAPDKINAVAIIKVKDEETGKLLHNAVIEILNDENLDTAFTDTRGVYKIKGIKKYDNYFIKVMADGYESDEFTISETDFKDRKKEWEVLLRKQKEDVTKLTIPAKLGEMPSVRLRGMIAVNKSNGPIYVVDGIIMPGGVDINPDDVDDYKVLQAPEAMALFGSQGANGAIVITTRKAKEKSLKEVVVTSSFGVKGMCRNTSIVTKTNLFQDTIKTLLSSFNNSLKIYPNPVQRSSSFSIDLKLKQTGSYQIQITDATGRIVLQKQINALAKEVTEKILADNRWSSGAYYISIIDNKNQLVNKKSFIVR